MTQQEIWKYLFNEQEEGAQTYSVSEWLNGFYKADLSKLPVLEDASIPHWNLFPIVGKSPEPEFWYRLSRGIFNINLKLRTEENLKYLEERDLFHDYFGHTPLLWNQEYSDYIRTLGLLGRYIKSEEGRKALSNVYWVTSEFGMKNSNGSQVLVYGAGILSSIDELRYATSEGKLKDFNIEEIVEIPSYVTDGFQESYYVINSWNQLTQALKYLWNRYV